MLLSLLPPKYQALAAALPAIFLLAFKVSAVVGSFGSVIEYVGMWRKWSTWIAVGKKFEAVGTDFPKLLDDHVRPVLIRIGVKGLSVLVALMYTACAAAPCSFRNPDYSIHVATCDRRIGLECERDSDGRALSSCPVLVECTEWARAVCR